MLKFFCDARGKGIIFLLSFQKNILIFAFLILIVFSSPLCAAPFPYLPMENPLPEMPRIPLELLGVETWKLPQISENLSVAMPGIYGTLSLSELFGSYFLLPPARGIISSPFGMRWGRMHSGIDIPLRDGTPIVAAQAGTVRRAESVPGYGRLVEIDHGNNMETRYAHCSMLAVSNGERVSPGQIIAYAGNTGRSTGPHLHFEVLVNGVARDPMSFLFSVF